MPRLREYKGDTSCHCGKDLPVYLTGGGMLTTSCGWCRLQLHCPVGSKSYRDLEAKIKTGIDPAPLDIPPPVRKVAVKPMQPQLAEKPPQAAPVPMPMPVPVHSEKTIFDIFN